MKIYKYFSSTLFNTSNSRKTIYICFQKYGLHKYKIKIKIKISEIRKANKEKNLFINKSRERDSNPA